MLIFIDESGNFRPFIASANNAGERHVTLAAVIFKDNNYSIFKTGLRKVRVVYKKYIGNKEIKSHTIRRSNPANINDSDHELYDFYKYGDEGKESYQRFCKELRTLVTETDFRIISVNADKVVTQQLYPYKNLLSTMLTDLWERIFICHHIEKPKRSRIFFDPQLNLTDSVIKTSYENFCKMGSWFIPEDAINKLNLYKRCFSPNSETSIGIQLADYVAYPIKRSLESSYDFFSKIVVPKLYPTVKDKGRGRYVIMGRKMTLSR